MGLSSFCDGLGVLALYALKDVLSLCGCPMFERETVCNSPELGLRAAFSAQGLEHRRACQISSGSGRQQHMGSLGAVFSGPLP